MIKRDWSRLRRWAGLVGALGLLSFVGAVVTRGPAPRADRSPVLLSRASGLASQSGAANPQLLGDSSVSGPYVTLASAASSSGAFRDIKPVAPVVDAHPMPELEARESEQSTRAPFTDHALQAPSGPASPSDVMPGLLRNFSGLDFNNNGSGWPPDTNGDVGPNHYVQVVNTSIGIFSKNGSPAASAQTFNALFSGSGSVCDGNNRGDPVALYDAQADRWIVADFAWINENSGPYYECIAASKTADPTGAWWRYALRADDNAHPYLNDYPKLGVWPDGIYMSANMFFCNGNCQTAPFKNPRVWALNRDDLYSGATLRAVVFDAGASYFSLLPSNFRGAAPPAGTPNYFTGNDLSVVALDVFKFHVDWTHPLSSTFTGPTQVSEIGYTTPPSTVPQGGTSVQVDSLGDRLMMQNQYRVISGTESLWLAHTAGNPTGVRWYQVNVTSGTVAATPVQQATYGPADSLNRWMPSLAVDKFGNMAVGYSASNSSQFPSIRYAGRLVTDTVSTLGQSEAVLISGNGAQTTPCGGGCANRWGDYSAMTVDPVDDCTFWFTTEYYAASGDDWQTRIGSFRFPICGPAAPPVTPRAYLPIIANSPPAGAWNTLMQEGFEGVWPSPGWEVTDSTGMYRWAQRNCRAATGSNSAWAIGGGSLGQGLSCGANYIDNAYSWMVYGPVSLADATGAEFDAKLWFNSEPTFDPVCLMTSIDGVNFDTSNAGTCYSGDSGGNFNSASLDLSDVYQLGNLLGKPAVWVAVVFQSDPSFNYPEGAYADDLLLRKCIGGFCPSGAFPAPGGSVHAQTAGLHRP